MNGSTSKTPNSWAATIHTFIDQPVSPQNLATISSPASTSWLSSLKTALCG
jgi:hypothetical protein